VIIRDLIEQGEQRLLKAGVEFGQGTLNAWDESRWLTLAALGLAVDSPHDIEMQNVDQVQQDRVRQFFDRRVNDREPAAYITGTAWLKGYSFRVDPRVIIPRSFLAELILDGFYPWIEDPEAVTGVLDLCTGSGCLAIMAAEAFPNAAITALDISADALDVARLNVADYQLQERVSLVQSDLFSQLRPPSDPRDLADSKNSDPKTLRAPGDMTTCPIFDLIISNPPYVPEDRMTSLPAEFLHEPEGALIAPDHGMALVRQILAQASRWLSPQGLLAVEVGHERQACEALCEAEFSGMPLLWIETQEQSDNVFLVDAPTLINHPWRPRP
jgi:ribosomal protein L3 glutamine methyltransferase